MADGALETLSYQKNLDLGGSFADDVLTKPTEEFIPAAWLYLLRRLSDLISDEKHEVRNGAVHTALRILGNYGDDLSPNIWQLSLKAILFRMIALDVKAYEQICEPETKSYNAGESEKLKSKIGTTKILLADSSKLIADYLAPISRAPKFKLLWTHLMELFAKYLSFHLHELTGATFNALNVIMTKASQGTWLDSSSIQESASVWHENFPMAASKLQSGSNLEAYEAYVTSFKSIYKFRKASITTADTVEIVHNLESCIKESERPSYSSDLDSMTELHSRVISCVADLRTDMKGSTSIVLGMLARFVGLPLTVPEVHTQRAGLTYIALSKSSMELIQRHTQIDAPWQELLHSDSLQLTLANLEKIIQQKYQRTRQGRNPPLWKKATTTAIAVLEQALPRIFDHQLSESALRSYWFTTVGIGNSIIHANMPAGPVAEGEGKLSTTIVTEDERFDIAAFEMLKPLLVPALGNGSIPDSTRRAHARSLFTASLVHHSLPNPRDDASSNGVTEDDDLPLRLDAEPLANLYTIRPGRTYDPNPKLRQEMAYTCFRALLDLLRSRQHDGADINSSDTEMYVRLAQAAAPYVILRGALPLKTYAADQPLRGKMPMPSTQVRELVTVLRGLGRLRCEKKAIPATDAVQSSEGGQLVRLYPLVVKVAALKGAPREVKNEVEGWLARLAEELGVTT
jgi:hypothetical protein